MALENAPSLIMNDMPWGQMGREMCRLATYRHYPANAAKFATSLARSGFVYIGDGVSDTVVCFYCMRETSNWEVDDDIEEAHNASCDRLMTSVGARIGTTGLQSREEMRYQSLQAPNMTSNGNCRPVSVSTNNRRIVLESDSNSASLDAHIGTLRDQLLRNQEPFMRLMRRVTATIIEAGDWPGLDVRVHTSMDGETTAFDPIIETPPDDTTTDTIPTDINRETAPLGTMRETTSVDTMRETAPVDSIRDVDVVGTIREIMPADTIRVTVHFDTNRDIEPVDTNLDNTPATIRETFPAKIIPADTSCADTKHVDSTLADTKPVASILADTIPVDSTLTYTKPADTIPLYSTPGDTKPADTSSGYTPYVEATPADTIRVMTPLDTIGLTPKQLTRSESESSSLRTMSENCDSSSLNRIASKCNAPVTPRCKSFPEIALIHQSSSSPALTTAEPRPRVPASLKTKDSVRTTTKKRLRSERPRSCIEYFTGHPEECRPAEGVISDNDGAIVLSPRVHVRSYRRSVSEQLGRTTEDELKHCLDDLDIRM